MFKRFAAWFGRTTLGGTIEFTPGSIVSRRGLLKEQARIQSYRRRRDGVPFVRLQLVATTPLSYQMHPIELRLSDARELVRLLEEAIQYFDTDESNAA
jgi:hypothetical protein